MSENKGQNYLHGAAIMAAGVVIMKIMGAIYKIPMGNLLGDEGFAHFNVAYSIYNVLLIVSTAGLPVAVSRLISEANTLNRPMQVKRIFRVALGAFAVLGSIGSLIMFLFPTELAAVMNDVEASQSILAMSPAVLLVCLASAYRGYAQGHSNMKPTTISQILEVGMKLVVGLFLVWMLARMGKSLPVRSAGAIFGVTVGALVSFIYLYIQKRRVNLIKSRPSASPDIPDKSDLILKNLLKIGIPIALGSSVMAIITLIDTALVLNRLQSAAGFSYGDAKVLFGVYSKAMTLYNLPPAFITSLAVSVVPAIAVYVAMKNKMEAKKIAEASLRISTIIALPMGVGLSVLSYPIMNVLYPNSNAAGPHLLLIMGIASYFVCMVLITTAALQAHGFERLPMISMVAGGVVKIVINWFLVADPNIGIIGAPIGTVSCYIVITVLNYVFLQTHLEEKMSLKNIMLRPIFSSAVMGAAAWAVYGLLSQALAGGEAMSRAMLALCMICAIGVGIILYIIVTITTRAITLDDMKLIPKGEKLAKMLKIK